MSDLVERLRSNSELVVCPFDRRSPEYWTTPNDKPCKFCGSEPEGPDKCTGADLRIMQEAADEIASLRAELSTLQSAYEEVCIPAGIIRAKAIEECAKLVDEREWPKTTYEETTSDMLENITAAIRALKEK